MTCCMWSLPSSYMWHFDVCNLSRGNMWIFHLICDTLHTCIHVTYMQSVNMWFFHLIICDTLHVQCDMWHVQYVNLCDTLHVICDITSVTEQLVRFHLTCDTLHVICDKCNLSRSNLWHALCIFLQLPFASSCSYHPLPYRWHLICDILCVILESNNLCCFVPSLPN